MVMFGSSLVVLLYLLTGALAGLSAGLFGIGGGIIVVPALYYLFRFSGFPDQSLMHMALGTSLFSIVFTGMASAWGHYRQRMVNMSIVYALTPWLLLGALLGATLAHVLDSRYLRYLFALFELLVAWRLFSDSAVLPRGGMPSRVAKVTGGLGIGVLSSLMGIGGGTLTVPFLLWHGIPLRNAIAVSAVCGIPIAMAGAGGMLLLGSTVTALPEHTVGYLYWPAAVPIVFASMVAALLGSRLARALPIAILRQAFALLLTVVGLRMLL